MVTYRVRPFELLGTVYDGFSRNINNTTMKSQSEIDFANFLDLHDILWEHEQHVVPLSDDVHHHLPDFYLPTRDLFIEIKSDKSSGGGLVRLNKVHQEYREKFVMLFNSDVDELVKTQSAAKLEELLSSRRFNDYPDNGSRA
jgi:hypothetical protein